MSNTNVWEQHPSALDRALELRSQNLPWSMVCSTLCKEFNATFTHDAVTSKLRKHWGKKRRSPKVVDTSKKSYLILSDIHIPFELSGLNDMVQSYVGKINGIIVAGDFLDMHACSKFIKNKDVALTKEMVRGYEYLKQWCDWFDEVIIFPGNHEDRLNTYMRGRIDPGVMFLVETEILKHFEHGFKITIDEDTEQHYPALAKLKVHSDWYIQVGDAIIAHPKSFSRTEGRTAMEADSYFVRHNYGHKTVIIGHTHQAAKITTCNRLVMEIGCNCKEQEYAMSGKLSMRPQVNAVGLLVQYDGVTDINETTYILYP